MGFFLIFSPQTEMGNLISAAAVEEGAEGTASAAGAASTTAEGTASTAAKRAASTALVAASRGEPNDLGIDALLSICSFAQFAHLSACSALLASLLHSPALTRSLTHSFTPELLG